MADSKAQAVREAAPYLLYFNQTLFSHGNFTESDLQRQTGYLSSSSFDYVRPENMAAVSGSREVYRSLTFADVERQAQEWPWGEPEEIRQRLIEQADRAGASTILISLNRGAMPQDLFLNQVRRFGTEVLPAIQAHQIASVPVTA